MTDLLTPDEVTSMERRSLWPYKDLARLCRDYLTLWDRNKKLKALIPKRLIQRVGGTETQ